MRKSIAALAAACALGAATMATGAMAQKGGGGLGGGHGGPSVGGAAAPTTGGGGGRSTGGTPTMSAAPMAAPSGAAGGRGPAQSVANHAATLNAPGSAPMNATGRSVAASPGARNYAWHDHDRHHHGHRFHGGFGFSGLYAYEPGYYDYGDDSCYQPRLVRTPYGLRWRQVWVCD